MSFPSHLIMDLNFKKTNNNIPYWTLTFTSSQSNIPTFLNELNFNNLGHNEVNTYSWLKFLRSNTNSHKTSQLPNLLTTLDNTHNNYTSHSNSYYAENLVNINFLRYERLYTKLKYSRSPAFDIVSGGAAALLAGFVGFLISEKFGFELVDSGDFYYLFMYGVFASFILKPFLYMTNVNESILKTLSYKNILSFFTKILLLLVNPIKSFFR